MDRLDALRTLVTVADTSSFAEAARKLHISPTAASRAVGQLEAELGVLLLRRTTRSVSVTPEGASYIANAREALNRLEDAQRNLKGELAEPSGQLVLTAPVVFGRMHVLPMVSRMMHRHKALNVSLTLSDRIVRIAEEGIDAAIRVGDLPDSALHAVKLIDVRRILVASPAYLAEKGTPEAISELLQHDLVAFENFTVSGEWRFVGADRESISVKPRFRTNDVASTIAATCDGHGIARLLSYQVMDELKTGKLVAVLSAFDPPPVPVCVVFQANRARSPNVRAFVDEARATFKQQTSV